MPDSLWTSETDAGMERPAEHSQVEERETRVEAEPLVDQQEDAAPPITLAVSADDFSALEERVLRAVEMLKHERQARASAEVRIAEAEELAKTSVERLLPLQTQLDQQTPLIDQLQNEIFSLRAERDTVRHRVERLLGQLDSLEI